MSIMKRRIDSIDVIDEIDRLKRMAAVLSAGIKGLETAERSASDGLQEIAFQISLDLESVSDALQRKAPNVKAAA